MNEKNQGSNRRFKFLKISYVSCDYVIIFINTEGKIVFLLSERVCGAYEMCLYICILSIFLVSFVLYILVKTDSCWSTVILFIY